MDGRKRYENDAKTISVDADRFENGTKQCCGRGLSLRMLGNLISYKYLFFVGFFFGGGGGWVGGL